MHRLDTFDQSGCIVSGNDAEVVRKVAEFCDELARVQESYWLELEACMVPPSAAESEFKLSWAEPLDEALHAEGIQPAVFQRRLAEDLVGEVKRTIAPMISRVRDVLQQRSDELDTGRALATAQAQLEAALVATRPPPPDESEAAEEVVEAPGLSLEEYLRVTLVDPVVGHFGRATSQAQVILAEGLDEAAQLDRVANYYLLALRRQLEEVGEVPEELARAGLERTQALLQQFRERRANDARRLHREFFRNVSSVVEEACAPIVTGPDVDLQRRLDALQQHKRARAEDETRWKPVVRGWASAVRLTRTLKSSWEGLIADQVGQRSLLHGLQLAFESVDPELPQSYRRLFSPSLHDVADVYVPRPEFEDVCVSTVRAWQGGRPNFLLVHGDRGSGKRTLLSKTLVEQGPALAVRWLRLSHELRTEADVANEISRVLHVEPSSTFEGLGSTLRTITNRSIVVLENADRISLRTVAGVDAMAKFLDVAASTSHAVLWILLMATPAYELVRRTVQLGVETGTTIHVDGMSPASLRRMLMARHRLSGYELRFASVRPRPFDWLSSPSLTRRRVSDPAAAFFEELHAAMSGNPRQALHGWLGSIRFDATRRRVEMMPLRTTGDLALEDIPPVQRLVLSVLVQHGSLSRREMVDVMGTQGLHVDRGLQALRSQGLVVSARGTDVWTVHPLLSHPITTALRRLNMV